MTKIQRQCCDAHDDALLELDEVRREFLSLVRAHGRAEVVPLGKVNGRILAQDITASLALPLRDNSAVDGYALGPADGSGAFFVVARTAAGESTPKRPVAVGQAVRIFTGAPVPDGCHAVAMQEHVEINGKYINLSRPVDPDQNIRHGGEDVRTGDKLIKQGTRLDARHVAILAALGVDKVSVAAPVKIAIFSSGKELVEPGEPLGPASIHDSNRWMLKSLMQGAMIEVDDLGILPDDRRIIAQKMAQAAERAELILSTGGVSVGEEDHIFAALSEAGGSPRQRRMAVKPGKPVVFGKIGRAVALGLPGNPVAALVSFHLLAAAAIRAIVGASELEASPDVGVASFDWTRHAGRCEYFPARRVGMTPEGLPVLEKIGQGGSARLRPLIEADGLARVARVTRCVVPGDRLDWFPFRAGFSL